MKSADFWYADGNIMIKAESTYYKLYRVRLARYCVYFKKLFADDADNDKDRCTTVESCPVYHIPAALASGDFENLLAVLETPLYVPAFTVSLYMEELTTSQGIHGRATDTVRRLRPPPRGL